jgi:hypothetical protein
MGRDQKKQAKQKERERKKAAQKNQAELAERNRRKQDEYCPVVFEDGFAKAKTFLYPGYTSTPEYGLLLRSKLSRAEREVLIESSTSLNADEVVLNENPETIKWFHDNGIPQVVQMKQTVFLH